MLRYTHDTIEFNRIVSIDIVFWVCVERGSDRNRLVELQTYLEIKKDLIFYFKDKAYK